MKIVVAIDSSESSEVVVNEVALRPWPQDTEVSVLTVLDLFSFPTGFSGIGPLVDVDLPAAEALVKGAAERFASRGLEVATAITEGYPQSSIVEYAEQWDADFVIVGSQGHSGLTRFLLGSVAQDVVRRARCSVGIVRATGRAERDGMKILMATDGSESSIAAARSIAARPWPDGSEVRVICAVQMAAPEVEPGETVTEADQIRESVVKRSEEDVAASEKIITDAGLKVVGAVLTGSPKATILDEAQQWGADLIVVGSHGRRGILRIFMGSVSEAVARHAHCSVDVIRQHP